MWLIVLFWIGLIGFYAAAEPWRWLFAMVAALAIGLFVGREWGPRR